MNRDSQEEDNGSEAPIRKGSLLKPTSDLANGQIKEDKSKSAKTKKEILKNILDESWDKMDRITKKSKKVKPIHSPIKNQGTEKVKDILENKVKHLNPMNNKITPLKTSPRQSDGVIAEASQHSTKDYHRKNPELTVANSEHKNEIHKDLDIPIIPERKHTLPDGEEEEEAKQISLPPLKGLKKSPEGGNPENKLKSLFKGLPNPSNVNREAEPLASHLQTGTLPAINHKGSLESINTQKLKAATSGNMKFGKGFNAVAKLAQKKFRRGAERARRRTRMQQNIFHFSEIEENNENSRYPSLFKFLNSTAFQLILLIVTFYTLFFDDYELLTSPKYTDLWYDIFSITAFAILIFELVLSSIAVKQYFNSYSFYLDLISALSIIFDLGMVKNAMSDTGQTSQDGIDRIGKLVRLLRLIRLFRISRVYKSFSNRANQRMAKDGSQQRAGKKDSRVGQKLSEVATKMTIMMVFILLICLPVFEADFWYSLPKAQYKFCSQYVNLMGIGYPQKANFKTLKYHTEEAVFDESSETKMIAKLTKEMLFDFSSKANSDILRIYFSDGNEDYYYKSRIEDLRKSEIEGVSCKFNSRKVYIFSDKKGVANLNAILNILRTLFISAVLMGGAYLFKSSTHSLVIGPIERMIAKIIRVIERPQAIKEEAFIQQEEKSYKGEMSRIDACLTGLTSENNLNELLGVGKKKKKLETMYLEEAITKIGVLLGVGLGEAGSMLINNYLNKDSNILNIAHETSAIFCFCDIRNFTDSTEILQEEAMIFVNSIAEIVHTTADMTLGAANKNVGDAFLIVWRMTSQDYTIIDAKKTKMDVVWTNLGDLAFFAVLKMHAEIGRSFSMRKFVENQMMIEKFGQNFKIKLGFGLHFGWAIEGALGSNFKVDVTYLSPHVNIAVKLEGDTKRYGVPILLSGEFYDLLSLSNRLLCRQIDMVYIDDGESLRYYTPKISDEGNKYSQVSPIQSHMQQTLQRVNTKKLIKASIFEGGLVGEHLFENDRDIAMLVERAENEGAFKSFSIAWDFYKGGHWQIAKSSFEKVLAHQPNDGPTLFLMDFMRKHDFKKPFWWKGIRNE